jgi:hypothetical protein
MLYSSLKQPRHLVDYRRKSACGYGHRRIGNRMQIPDGCAAVAEDEGPINATLSQVNANPFAWLDEVIFLRKEKNFFETRVTEYQTSGSVKNTSEEDLI